MADRIFVGYWPAGEQGRQVLTGVQKPDFAQSPDFPICLWFCTRPETVTRWAGSSTCRLCGRLNGAMCLHHGDLTWPEGYRHYIEVHQVQPPLEFIAAARTAWACKPEDGPRLPEVPLGLPNINYDLPPDIDTTPSQLVYDIHGEMNSLVERAQFDRVVRMLERTAQRARDKRQPQ